MRFGPPLLEKRMTPARSPSASITKTPNTSGSSPRALDVAEDALAIGRPRCGEKRLDVLVLGEADEEVEIVRPRTAYDDAHKISSAVFGRRHATTSPDPSATPRRINASPMSMPVVIGSSRNSAPYAIAKAGMT